MTANTEKFVRRIDQAMGNTPADLVIKNVTLLNVATGSVEVTDIAICGDTIVGTYETYSGTREIDGTGLTAVPGFIDTHVHVESSILSPYEFDRCVLPRGTTTAICDPHEMANVLGTQAFDYFLASAEGTVMDLKVQLSSCVPATPLETSGANVDANALLRYKGHAHGIGLAEFMDIGGVLGKNPDTLAKLAAFDGGHIDGHMPGIRGHAMNAMTACGIANCHESTTLDEAVEKLEKGVVVLIRHGSVCKDLETLLPLIEPFKSSRLGFCTDDRKPTDITREGHIDHIIRTAIAGGADPLSVYRIATLSAAEGFGLKDRGLIAPGKKADIVLLRDVNTCDIAVVIKDGELVTESRFENRPAVAPIGYGSVHLREISAGDLAVHANTKLPSVSFPVIGLIRDQIVTQSLTENMAVSPAGTLDADPARDILKIAVLERHGKNGNIARGFVKGFGIENGAIASSVGHDSHNITVVGTNDADMALAVNRLRDIGGGFVVVKDGAVQADLPLAIAGLMSDQPYEKVIEQLDTLMAAVDTLQPAVSQPFMYMSFLPLCVIPELKITDYGLVRFNPAGGDIGPVIVQDQRGGTAAKGYVYTPDTI